MVSGIENGGKNWGEMESEEKGKKRRPIPAKEIKRFHRVIKDARMFSAASQKDKLSGKDILRHARCKMKSLMEDEFFWVKLSEAKKTKPVGNDLEDISWEDRERARRN
jgi:hypothetical protein